MQKTKTKLSTLQFVLLFIAAVLVLGGGMLYSSAETTPVSAATGMEIVEYNFGPLSWTDLIEIPVPNLTKANFVEVVLYSGYCDFWDGSKLSQKNLVVSFTYIEPMQNWDDQYSGKIVLCGKMSPGGSQGYVNFRGVTGVVRYYQPVNQVVEYTVNFELSNGTRKGGGELIQTVVKGSFAVAPTVERQGFNFAGWLPDGATTPYEVSTYAINKNTTFVAKWVGIETPVEMFTLTIDFNGGNLGGDTSLAVTVPKGTVYTLPQNPVYPSWDFLHYKSSTGATYTTTVVVNSNMTLTAQWTYAGFFTVTFDLNGGTRTGGGTLVQTVNPNGYAVEPEITRPGYEFAGWKVGEYIRFPHIHKITQNTTYVAQWYQPSGFVIRFELGDMCDYVGGGALVQQVAEGQAPEFPEMEPKDEKMQFRGWSLKENGTTYINIKNYRATADATLYAVWYMPKLCKVEFVYDDGEKAGLLPYIYSGDVLQFVYETEYAFAPSIREVAGMSFLGWCVGNSSIIVDVGTYKITGDTVFRSKFSSTKYVVTFNLNGGTQSGGGALSQEVIYPAKPVLPIVSRPNFNLLGWRYKDSAGVEQTILSITEFAITAPFNTEFMAIWGVAVSIFNNKTAEEAKVTAEIVNNKYVLQIPYFKGTVMDLKKSNAFMKFSWGGWTNGLAQRGKTAVYEMRADKLNDFLLYMYGNENTIYNGKFFDFQMEDNFVVRSMRLGTNDTVRLCVFVDENGDYILQYIELTLEKPSITATYELRSKVEDEEAGKLSFEWYIPAALACLDVLLLVAAFFLLGNGHAKEGAICLLIALAAAVALLAVFFI